MWKRQGLVTRRLVFILGTLFLAGTWVRAGDTTAANAKAKEIEERMRKDITFLASDECEGRGVTTKGINLAADFIAGEFKKAGLQPISKDNG
jgi:hypothetical protein